MRVALAVVMATLTLGLTSRLTPALQVRDDVSPLESIEMIDAQIGWAATARCGPCPPHVVSGSMLHTTTGGTQWKDVTPVDSSGQRIDVPYFRAFNSRLAWVAKTSLVATTEIFRTTDGGRTWKTAAIAAPSVTSISFVSPHEGWLIAFLVAASGANEFADVYRSTDGGETWIRVAESTGLPYGVKRGIVFLNSMVGWITVSDPRANRPYLYTTRDGGRTWRQQNMPLPRELTPRWEARPDPPKFFTARDGVLPTSYALLNDQGERTGMLVVFYVTHDGGTTWTYPAPVPVRQTGGLRRLPSHFVDVNHGWVKEEDVLYVTDDGGRRWTTIHPNQLFADVTQLDFTSPKVGLAVRNTDPYGGGARQTPPFLLKTLDGGRTWAPVPYMIVRE